MQPKELMRLDERGHRRGQLVRRRDEDSDQPDLWLDPSRNMLPLKIYYEDRRRTILEQNIREYSAEAAP